MTTHKYDAGHNFEVVEIDAHGPGVARWTERCSKCGLTRSAGGSNAKGEWADPVEKCTNRWPRVR